MKVRKALSDTGQFLKDAAPKFQERPLAPTARDAGTASLAMAVTVLIGFAIRQFTPDIEVPLEVMGALASVVGFAMGRLFKY